MSQKISDMTAASALAAADLLPIVQGGSNKSITAQKILDLVGWNVQSKSTTFTAAVNYFYLLTTTGGAYTVTLPAASGNAGAKIGFIIVSATASTPAIVTIDGNGSETIWYDGAASLTLPIDIQGSIVELICDGSGWTLIRDERAALFAQITRASSQTINSSGSYVRIDFDTKSQNSDVSDVTTNRKITVKRAGRYVVFGGVYPNGDLVTIAFLVIAFYVNGSIAITAPISVPGNINGASVCSAILDLAVNDYVQLYVATDDAAITTRTAAGVQPILIVVGPIK